MEGKRGNDGNFGKNGELVKVAMASAPHTALSSDFCFAIVAALRLPFGLSFGREHFVVGKSGKLGNFENNGNGGKKTVLGFLLVS